MDAAGFSIGNYGYIATGNAGGFTYDLWQYDPSAGTWAEKDSLPLLLGNPRDNAACFVIGNYAYLGTGFDGVLMAPASDFWRYDPSANSWMQILDLQGTARAAAVGFSIGGKGYIHGGWDINMMSPTYYDDLWELSPPLGINEADAGSMVSVYPNPTSSTIQVISNQYSVRGLEIYNVMGEKVFQSPNSELRTHISLDLSSHPDGIYFITIKTDKENIVEKLIINK